jgi:signal transduction histidine kinase
LSALNSHLLLLTKIENGQFEAGTISLNKVIRHRLDLFQPLVAGAGLKIHVSMPENFQANMHEALAEILVNNLLSNAIKHNKKDGEIYIEVTENSLEICNSGNPEPLNEKEIFNRFVKKDSKGLGLGLSLVRQICHRHGLSVTYRFSGGRHCFRVQQALLT